MNHGTCPVCDVVVDLDQYGRVALHFDPKGVVEFTNLVMDPKQTTVTTPCPGTRERPWGSA